MTREAKRSAMLRETLPAGITLGFWKDGRAKPWYVRHGPERKVSPFATEKERNDAAERLAVAVREEGNAVLEFDPKEWREYRAFRERCPAPFSELERLWREHQAASGFGLLTREAVTRYMELRLAEDVTRDSDTHRHLKKHLEERFVTRFGVQPVGTITPDELRDWLASLKNPKNGQPMANLTKRHHRKDVNTFFKRAVAEGWRRDNPCEVVKPPKVDDEDVSVMPARDIFELLRANRDEAVVGRIAFELFGGLRCSSVERLTRDRVNVDERGIELPGQVHKSGKRKYRQGHPSVLWAWEAHAAPGCWDHVSEKNYDHQKGAAFVRARVGNPGNGLRHSFASYLLASTKSFPLVGYLMQHKHASTTEKYEGMATEADARLVFCMTPEAVTLAWEDFVAQVEAGTLVPDIPKGVPRSV